MKTIHLTMTAALLTVVLLLSGCGSDDSESSSEPTATEAEADGGETEVSGDPDNGRELYVSSCQSCHGPDAEGIDGLGKTLVGSEFVAATSGSDLVAFVKVGRPTSDPDNTTGIDMPPKGGNPSLTDEQIADIVAYMKSLN